MRHPFFIYAEDALCIYSWKELRSAKIFRQNLFFSPKENIAYLRGEKSKLWQKDSRSQMPRIGVEPTHLAVPEPKSGVSANFTTWAKESTRISVLQLFRQVEVALLINSFVLFPPA